jgi:hypothetical protein
MTKTKKIITGYKAFDEGMKCKNFQFEEGKEYKHKGEIKICKKGFHFCINPLDVLNYYNLCDSEFAEVEASGKIEKNKNTDKPDSKIVTNKIKIKAKLDLTSFVKLSVDFLLEKCGKKNDKNLQSASGHYSQLATSGHYSQLAASGDSSQLAASGHSSQLAASGHSSQLAASGDSSQLAASGHYSQLAASGDSS